MNGVLGLQLFITFPVCVNYSNEKALFTFSWIDFVIKSEIDGPANYNGRNKSICR